MVFARLTDPDCTVCHGTGVEEFPYGPDSDEEPWGTAARLCVCIIIVGQQALDFAGEPVTRPFVDVPTGGRL